MTEGKCVIVGAGEYGTEQISKEKGDYLIAADGGLGYCLQSGVLPDLVVGDMDSLSESDRSKLREGNLITEQQIIQLPREKDDTDMLYATRIGLKKGYRRFCFYGAMGKRLDHTMANIQVLVFLKQQGARGCLVNQKERVFVIKDEAVTLPYEGKGRVSVFSLSEHAQGVSISGLKYTLQDGEMENGFPIGVSNEFVGTRAYIEVKKGMLLIMVCLEGEEV